MLLVSVGLLEPLLLPLDPVEILTNVGKHSTQVPVPLREICTSPPPAGLVLMTAVSSRSIKRCY